jgi:aminoglycoside 2''-phosphotransferase
VPAAKHKSLLTRRIRECCPGLPIRSVRRIDAGQYNDVLVLNEEWIFRFPRFAEGVARLESETALLHFLRGAVTLAIPDPALTCFDPPVVGQVFAAYRLIPGLPLWRETLAQIDDGATLDRFARQLACFLRELHGAAREGTPLLPAPDPLRSWNDLYRRMQARLFPYMSEASRRRASGHFEDYLAAAANLSVEPVIVHGDLGGSNILFDASRGAITGVIDFGSCHLGDAALDLAALATFGEPFLQRILGYLPGGEAMLGRARFYRGTFALQEALYGVEHDDRAAMERGIAGFEAAGPEAAR